VTAKKRRPPLVRCAGLMLDQLDSLTIRVEANGKIVVSL